MMTELTKPIQEIKEYCEIVPKIKTYKEGMLQVIDQNILGMLFETYLPKCQKLWQGYVAEFNNRLIPNVNMLLLY